MGVHLYTNGAWTDSGRIYRNSINLLNPISNWIDGYISDTGIVIDPSSAHEITSDFTSILPSTNIAVSYENGASFPSIGTTESTNAWWAISFFTAQKIFLARYTRRITATVPSNSAYVRFSFRTFNETGNVMMNYGSSQRPYEPHNVFDWYTNNGHNYSSGAW